MKSKKEHPLTKNVRKNIYENQECKMSITKIIKTSIVIGAAFFVASCATYPEVNTNLPLKPLVLEEYFQGRTKAQGTFTNRINGKVRAFTVALEGKWDGKILTLAEDFIFEDGEKDRKVWTFEKVDANTYIGRRDDVVGTADVNVKDGIVRLSYVADLKTGDSTTRLKFHDTLALQNNGIVLNRAVVSKFGIPIGKVDLSFTR
jgi:Protein of unknown function (DUF3833)